MHAKPSPYSLLAVHNIQNSYQLLWSINNQVFQIGTCSSFELLYTFFIYGMFPSASTFMKKHSWVKSICSIASCPLATPFFSTNVLFVLRFYGRGHVRLYEKFNISNCMWSSFSPSLQYTWITLCLSAKTIKVKEWSKLTKTEDIQSLFEECSYKCNLASSKGCMSSKS